MKRCTSGFAVGLVISSCAVAAAQTSSPSTQDSSAGREANQAAQVAQLPPAPTARREAVTERINITVIPAGVVFVRQGNSSQQPSFDSYTPGGAVALKLTDRIDVEGEVAWGIGRTQNLHFDGQDLGAFKPPNLFGYTGNVLVNLGPGERMFVPYGIAGIGGVRVSNREELGITSSENLLTGDVGVGAKLMWGPLGVRADYRFFILNTKGNDASFVGDDTRYGHRIYAGLVVAPGRHKAGS